MIDRRLDALLLEVEIASAKGLSVPFATVASIRSCIEEMIAAFFAKNAVRSEAQP